MRDSSSWAADLNRPSTSSSRPRGSGPCKYRNVFQLVAQREISPQTKRSSKKLWKVDSKDHHDLKPLLSSIVQDPKHDLLSWVEAESLRNLSSKYCPLLPAPRSTIASAFSPDGKTLASTHGDHTVKIIDWATGRCLKVLRGHRRTPWVVRFHPLYPDILASGSLDHEVRLWDAKKAESIGSRDFGRPIASIAFHAQGEILAVASGHKLYIWHYSRRGETSSPAIILKTRRSLRAVHFHPHAAPFLLTAEVNDLDSSDTSMALATSPGYLQYPPPTVYVADAHSSGRSNLANDLPLVSLPFLMWPSFARDTGRTSLLHADSDGLVSGPQRGDQSASVRLLTYSTPSGQYELLLSPIEPVNPSLPEEAGSNPVPTDMETEISDSGMVPMETVEAQPAERSNQFFPFGDPTSWDIPFLQGWLIGQTQAGQLNMGLPHASGHDNAIHAAESGNSATVMSSSATILNVDRPQSGGRSGSRYRSSQTRVTAASGPSEAAGYDHVIQSELATTLARRAAAAAAAELPCTVKLRIWFHNMKDPCAPLDPERCRLTIPHAVLCSEMGAHFSPCGRFLAACVACVLPRVEADPGQESHFEATGAATSPTRHPISAHQVLYELRIYSLEEATFGSVLASRAIRAAHCLTSIQFSPTSEHILLAYGRRHSSLLKSVVIDGETTVPIFTILEVYRVSDMELVRILPSAEDEVNVACFHPSVGGGLVYGTKEGKLRILQYESSLGTSQMPSSVLNENMLQVPTLALEC